MTRATFAALLLWTSALHALLQPSLAGSKPAGENELESDDESDAAPFMIVVEHGNGRRCGGSLLSLRTALTSAWCVRGARGGNPRELWVLSPGVPSVGRPASRRVSRVALVSGAESDSPPPHLQPGWLGASLDIAILELEAPFGGGARTRAILMATLPEECAVGTLCHIVQVRGRKHNLRIVDATIVKGEVCGAATVGWPALRESALCLSGPTLCAIDRGTGVVCNGKLCGVLSRSVPAGGASSQNKTTDTTMAVETFNASCGDTHVALSAARMRRFLHCAHTLRACGRGGECSQQCSERQLMVLEPMRADPAGGGGEVNLNLKGTTKLAVSTTEHNQPERTALTLISSSTSIADYVPMFKTSVLSTPARTVAPVALVSATAAQVSSSRPTFEFEPNRADFRGAPARTSRVYLKAGEYGDNALDYGDAEESAAGAAPASTTTPVPSLPAPLFYASPPSRRDGSLPTTIVPAVTAPTHTELTSSSIEDETELSQTTVKTTVTNPTTLNSTDDKASHVRVAAKRVPAVEGQAEVLRDSASICHSTLMSIVFVMFI